MPRSHPPYAADFGQQMAELVRAGRSPTELAEEFSYSDQTIPNWVAQSAVGFGMAAPGEDGLTIAEREELVMPWHASPAIIRASYRVAAQRAPSAAAVALRCAPQEWRQRRIAYCTLSAAGQEPTADLTRLVPTTSWLCRS